MGRKDDTQGRAQGPSLLAETIDARRLTYFYHVAKAKRLTSAESVLGVAQSAISRQIQQLEADLGVDLLVRTGRGVELTEHGKLLFDHAETILGDMSAAVTALRDLSSAPGGSVSIAAPTSVTGYLMGDVFTRFHTRHPNVRLRLIESTTGGVFNLLVNGTVDLAIVTYPVTRPRIESHKLFDEPLYLVCRRDHEFATMDRVARTRLRDARIILPASLHGTRSSLADYFEAAGIELKSLLEVDSLPLILDLIDRLNGVAILPYALHEDISRRQLVTLPLEPRLDRTVFIANMRANDANPWVPLLRKEVQDCAAHLRAL